MFTINFIRIGRPAAIALILAGLFPIAARAGDLSDTIVRIKPSIVGVGTFQQTRNPAVKLLATGFVVADGRHVITNAHAIPNIIDVEHREFLTVLIPGDKGSARPAQVVKRALNHDLAVLRFSGGPLPALKFASTKEVKEGDLFAFTGFPIGMVLGMHPATHRGIISAITPIAIPQISLQQLDQNMIHRLKDPYDIYQLDATAYPGNSGSPLFDPSDGHVVGVINKVFVKESKEAALEKPSGITYAIPARYVEDLLKKAGL